MENKLLSTREAAMFLGVHVNTVRNMVRDGRIHSIKTKGTKGDYRFRQADLEAILAGEYPSSSSLSQRVENQSDFDVLKRCCDPYLIFGSYLETASLETYRDAVSGKSAIWVQETLRQLHLQADAEQEESILQKLSIGISGMRKRSGKLVITSYLLFTDETETYLLDATLQQFHSNVAAGLLVFPPLAGERYYEKIAYLEPEEYLEALADPARSYFQRYIFDFQAKK